MKRTQKLIVFFCAAFLVSNGDFYNASADHHRRKEQRRYQKKYRHHSETYTKKYLTPVNKPIYKKECGTCHFAYQPGLLPSGSWDKILAGFEDHFGEVIELTPDSKKAIDEYLKTNSAEHSTAKRSIKIMKSLGSQTPMRVTETPYIKGKHKDINPDVLKCDVIGSLSNCSACNKTAEQGIYDDDHVSIPQ